jgi:Ca2+-binding RTX toxin-like protein
MKTIAILLVCALVLIAGSNGVSGSAAAIAIPGSSGGTQVVGAITANDLKPASCAGINLTAVVSGAGAINGTAANELILGSAGADTITANGGDDCILAGGGDDLVDAGPGFDVLLGGSGDDTLNGGDDDDTLYGGPDTDICSGDAGADTFPAADCETEIP